MCRTFCGSPNKRSSFCIKKDIFHTETNCYQHQKYQKHTKEKMTTILSQLQNHLDEYQVSSRLSKFSQINTENQTRFLLELRHVQELCMTKVPVCPIVEINMDLFIRQVPVFFELLKQCKYPFLQEVNLTLFARNPEDWNGCHEFKIPSIGRCCLTISPRSQFFPRKRVPLKMILPSSSNTLCIIHHPLIAFNMNPNSEPEILHIEPPLCPPVSSEFSASSSPTSSTSPTSSPPTSYSSFPTSFPPISLNSPTSSFPPISLSSPTSFTQFPSLWASERVTQRNIDWSITCPPPPPPLPVHSSSFQCQRTPPKRKSCCFPSVLAFLKKTK